MSSPPDEPTCPHCHKSLAVEPKCSLCKDTGRVTKGSYGPTSGGYFLEPCPNGCSSKYLIMFGRNAA